MASITTAEANELNVGSPINQKLELGTEIKKFQDNGLVVISKVIDADAKTEALSIDIPFDIKIIDVIVTCTAAVEAGTAQLRNSTTAISDAIIMAANHVVDRAGTLDDAQVAVGASDSINVLTNETTNRGVITILALRV